MTHKYQAIADKYAGQNCKLYTLNGVLDAVICGRLEKFATVVVEHNSGYNVQFNWPIIARKMESDKTFYAC